MDEEADGKDETSGKKLDSVNATKGYEIPGPAKNFIAGGFGGMCLVAAGHPFDTIKVRLQTAIISSTTTSSNKSNIIKSSSSSSSSLSYNGAFDCFRKTFVNEGILGFYKGMGTPLLMVTPLFALSFFGYGLGKTVIAKVTDKTPNPQGKPPLQGQKAVLAAPSHLFCAGAISSCLTTFIVTPVERIKCLLQVQTQSGASNMKSVYRGPLHCATTLLKEGGIPNLYKGFGATLLRGIPQSGLYFMTYDVLKDMFSKGTGELSTGMTLVAGGLTGVINWSLVLPLDVVKSQVQIADRDKYPRGIRDVLPNLIKTEGIRGLYRGIVPVFIRAFPANAACFMGFETAMKVMKLIE